MVASAGVDTWSVCWYLKDDGKACRAMEQLATIPAPRSKLLEDSVEGHRVGWFPGARLLFAEGHPAPEGVLAGGSELPGVLERLVEGLTDRGIPVPKWNLKPWASPGCDGPETLRPALGHTGFAGIRRLDSTVDMAFDDPLLGLSALAGVAALPLPRVKTETIREEGGRRIETVTLRSWSGRNVLGRWYDKGVESGELARGRWIRPEDQRRFRSDTRPPVEALASTGYIRDQFVKRFEPLWRASKGVKVGGVLAIGKRLDELIEAGTLTARQAESLAGFMVLDACGAQGQSRATRMRRRAMLRDQGLVLSDGVLEEVEVDLGLLLEEAMDSDAWGAQG